MNKCCLKDGESVYRENEMESVPSNALSHSVSSDNHSHYKMSYYSYYLQLTNQDRYKEIHETDLQIKSIFAKKADKFY